MQRLRGRSATRSGSENSEKRDLGQSVSMRRKSAKSSIAGRPTRQDARPERLLARRPKLRRSKKLPLLLSQKMQSRSYRLKLLCRRPSPRRRRSLGRSKIRSPRVKRFGGLSRLLRVKFLPHSQ